MHCASCSARVEKALSKMEGVHSASVNLPLEEAAVDFDDAVLNTDQIKETIVRIGFQVRELPLPEDETEQEDIYVKAQRQAWNRMWIAWGLTILVMGLMLPEMLSGKMVFSSHIFNVLLMTGLSLATMLIHAHRVYVSAWKSLTLV